MFNDTVVAALVRAADGAGIKRAALLALVETETAGKPFEDDGRTPALLYERHVAWLEAGKVSQKLRAAFAVAGLAIMKWSRATQYKDQRNSSSRLALIGKARAINAEVANRSASWGLPQIMGFNAEGIGFETATHMVAYMTADLDAQIDVLVRNLRKMNLIAALNRGDWVRVARTYNGPGYAANRYDVKLADANKRWERKLVTLAAARKAAPLPAEQSMSVADLKEVQRQLRVLGYAEAGEPNGVWGTRSVAAVAAFQAHEGLPVNGSIDDATREALAIAVPREASKDRARATADDLSSSRTIKAADKLGLIAKIKAGVGSLIVGGGGAEYLGVIDRAQEGIEKIDQVKGVWESATDLLGAAFSSPTVIIAGVILIGGGVAVYFLANAIRSYRVEDHNSGAHAGVVEG